MTEEILSKDVRRAFLAARIIKYSGVPSSILLLLVACAGFSKGALAGLGLILLYMVCLAVTGSLLARLARCPQCNAFWRCRMRPQSVAGQIASDLVRPGINYDADETRDLKCRRCGLPLGPHLKK